MGVQQTDNDSGQEELGKSLAQNFEKFGMVDYAHAERIIDPVF